MSGAIGGLGVGLGTTILANGVGNVVEATLEGDISSFKDVLVQFALGGVIYICSQENIRFFGKFK